MNLFPKIMTPKIEANWKCADCGARPVTLIGLNRTTKLGKLKKDVCGECWKKY